MFRENSTVEHSRFGGLGRRAIAVVSIVGVLLAQSGCAAMVRYESPSLTNRTTVSTHNVRSLGFLWGLVPPSRVSLDQCGDEGIQAMKVRQAVTDKLITWGSAGIIISYKVRIKCAERGPVYGNLYVAPQELQ
jgi:hypothetical protein